jgi:hypothetical protein
MVRIISLSLSLSLSPVLYNRLLLARRTNDAVQSEDPETQKSLNVRYVQQQEDGTTKRTFVFELKQLGLQDLVIAANVAKLPDEGKDVPDETLASLLAAESEGFCRFNDEDLLALRLNPQERHGGYETIKDFFDNAEVVSSQHCQQYFTADH